MARKKLIIKQGGKIQDIINNIAKGYATALKNRYGPEKAKEVHQAVVGAFVGIKKIENKKDETVQTKPADIAAPTQDELDDLQKLADLSELEKLGAETPSKEDINKEQENGDEN